jgi:hypothetical protein
MAQPSLSPSDARALPATFLVSFWGWGRTRRLCRRPLEGVSYTVPEIRETLGDKNSGAAGLRPRHSDLRVLDQRPNRGLASIRWHHITVRNWGRAVWRSTGPPDSTLGATLPSGNSRANRYSLMHQHVFVFLRAVEFARVGP